VLSTPTEIAGHCGNSKPFKTTTLLSFVERPENKNAHNVMGHYERSIFTTFGGVLVIFDYNAYSLVQSVLRGEDMRVFQYAAFGGR